MSISLEMVNRLLRGYPYPIIKGLHFRPLSKFHTDSGIVLSYHIRNPEENVLPSLPQNFDGCNDGRVFSLKLGCLLIF